MNKDYFSVYESDASQLKGKAKDVFVPESIDEIKKLVRAHSSITPRGGGTGLVGSAVPENSVIIDVSKLNKILDLDKNKKIVKVEAGILLDDLNNYLESYGLEFPINPSSHAVCTVGGMIATDAVGSRAIKYGRTSDWVESIEVVGEKGLEKIKKSDLKNYAGLEGTTGIIVCACLNLSERKTRTMTLINKKSAKEIIEEVKKLKGQENISMTEFLGKQVSEMLGMDDYNLIVEYESEEGELSGEKYFNLMNKRDGLYPVLAQKGYVIIEDPVVSLNKILELVSFLEKNKIPYFGHIGSGILHPCFSKEQENSIPEMMKLVKKLDGQITGEHGIGLLKKEFLSKKERDSYSRIKRSKDRKNKFNKGKII